MRSVAGNLRGAPPRGGRPRSSSCSYLVEDFPAGDLLRLSRPSWCQPQGRGRLLLPRALPRTVLWGLLQTGLGGADCSSGCGGKGSPVEEEEERVRV